MPWGNAVPGTQTVVKRGVARHVVGKEKEGAARACDAHVVIACGNQNGFSIGPQLGGKPLREEQEKEEEFEDFHGDNIPNYNLINNILYGLFV